MLQVPQPQRVPVLYLVIRKHKILALNSMALRILHVIGITFTFATGPWFVALPWLVFYIIWWRGVEIIIVAFLADSFYGSSFPVPLYSSVAMLVYLLWMTIRPRLLLYTST